MVIPLKNQQLSFFNTKGVSSGDFFEIKKLNQRILHIIESISDSFIAFDKEWNFLYINSLAEKYLGKSANSLLGRNFWDIFPELRNSEIHTKLQEAVLEGQAKFEEYRAELNVWFEIKVSVSDENIFIFFNDISQRKQDEEKLLYSEKYFRLIAEVVPQIVWTSDNSGKINYCNKRWREYTGIELHETQRHWKGIIHSDDEGKSFKYWHKAFKKNEPFDLEFRIKSKEGSYQWFLSRAVPVKDDNGNPVKWIGSLTNINDQIKAREHLKISEERFRAMVDSAPVLIWMSNKQKRFTFFNKAWLEFRGKELNKEAGYRWTRDIHPEDRQMYLDCYKSAFDARIDFEIEYRLKRFDEEYRWILNKGIPQYDYNGGFIGYIGSCVDITERKELEKRKDEFIGIASHELKTPLTSIKAYTQILLKKLTKVKDAEVKRYLNRMIQHIDDLNELISDLLDVSKIEQHKLLFNKQNFSIMDLVKEVVDDFSALQDTHKLILEGSTDKMILGDKQRVKQVLINFISNAIKYSPGANKVIIRVGDDNRCILISVQDFGIGIPKQYLSKIFDRFYRVPGERKETFPGLGLGLYISSEIIKRHGGSVWVKSKKNAGATFYLSIPLKK